MTQTLARLKLVQPAAKILRLGAPHLALHTQLRYVGQIIGGKNISVTTVNGVTTIANSIPFSTSAIEFAIDGGGPAIGAGYKGVIEVPFACTITGVKLMADAPGNLVMDIRRKTFATLPFIAGDTIVGATPPTLSAAQFSTDSALVGWSTAILANDILGFYVTSGSVGNVTLSLLVQRF